MLQIEFYTSVNQLPDPAWNQFASRTSVGLETGHLRAIEESRINDIHPYYLIGYDEERPVGIAYCLSIRADLSTMATDYPKEVIETVKSWKPGFMDLRIVEVGHLASLGTTIEVEEEHREEFLRVLT